ncbi:Protein transport protein Sec16B [Tupaia chinensis]|uniref:Protein transport protein Sec16B n=1 Tax=Tupaia chinensis TaxID=246437 RepID=L8YAS5_TUPCH|nr:Protein transport protein Sec16B [Tupaia chinensis]
MRQKNGTEGCGPSLEEMQAAGAGMQELRVPGKEGPKEKSFQENSCGSPGPSELLVGHLAYRDGTRASGHEGHTAEIPATERAVGVHGRTEVWQICLEGGRKQRHGRTLLTLRKKLLRYSGTVFTSTLSPNDPLQTLFQFMSGRIPQAATCCGDKQWGDWRPHLAVILSNQAGDPELHQRAIVTMGDTLAGKGLVAAAHFCYIMAHVPLGHYTVKTDHLALLGSSHSQEFSKFATTEAIQRTEIFEYCQMLGRPKSFIPSFQVYKLLYASRLADYGLVTQALQYCEAIGAAVLSQGENTHPVLLAELIKLAEKLKLSDPLVLGRRHGDRDLEPDWLVQLRRQHQELEVSGAGGKDDASHPDLVGYHGYSEGPGYLSAPWPAPEQTGPIHPSPQQPSPLQMGSYTAAGSAGQLGTPVPLYPVPETYVTETTDGSMAVTGAPGGRTWEGMPQTHMASGENTVSQDTSQHADDQRVTSKPQAPLVPRVRNPSESSTISGKEDEEESSDEADQKSPRDAAHGEKLGDGKGNTKSSGFGWFSWFRSKPSNHTSGDEDSSDGPEAEVTLGRGEKPSRRRILSAVEHPQLCVPLTQTEWSRARTLAAQMTLLIQKGNLTGAGYGAVI